MSVNMVGHHAPDEAGEFTGDSGSGNIVWAGEIDSFEFAFETFIGLIGVCNDRRFISLLSGFQRLGFSSDLTSAVALGGFREQCSKMGVSFLGDAGSSDIGAAGVLSRHKAQISREMIC